MPSRRFKQLTRRRTMTVRSYRHTESPLHTKPASVGRVVVSTGAMGAVVDIGSSPFRNFEKCSRAPSSCFGASGTKSTRPRGTVKDWPVEGTALHKRGMSERQPKRPARPRSLTGRGVSPTSGRKAAVPVQRKGPCRTEVDPVFLDHGDR